MRWFFLGARLFAAGAALGALTACGHGSSLAQPSAIVLTGEWEGRASDSSGSGRMSWSLLQDGDRIIGTATIRDESTGAVGNGTLSGVVTNGTITFTLTLPAGAFGEPFSACAATVVGQGVVANTGLTVEYEGVSSCSGPIVSGRVVLTRR